MPLRPGPFARSLVAALFTLAIAGTPLAGFADLGRRVADGPLAAAASPAVPDLVVDTVADDQPYEARFSLTECTDATPGNCTLREAIEVANANAGLDVIGFDIPGRGVATIQPTSPLPPLTDAGVTLDGYTQPGASPNTRAVGTDAVLGVEIDGTSAGGNGLTLGGAGQRVTGLAIYRFSTGIRIVPAAANAVVAGNYVGTDATGTADLGNAGSGVFVNGAPGVRIGTDGDGTADAAERNVISGNDSNGVYVAGREAANAVVAGNYVGTDATGTADLGNSFSGVVIADVPSVRIGTDGDGVGDAAERNVISGNDSNGAYVFGAGAAGADVAGNYIGTDAAGTADLGNAGHGVFVDGAPNVRVGTDGHSTADDTEGNIISGNGSHGVLVSGADATGAVVAGNDIHTNGGDGVFVSSGSASVLGNAIAGNAGLGIDLGADGVLANDPDDPDAGASDLQNYPVVTAAMAVGDDTVVFTLDSTPRTDFRVELFASPTADPTGYGEGARFLGAVTVTTDGRGDATGAWPAAGGLVAGEVVTATATAATGPSAFGGTSEFSKAVVVGAFLVDTRSDDQTYVAGVSEAECTDATPGNCTLREAIEVANANAGLDVIGFDIPGRGVATIQPTSPLPPLTDAGVTLDGYTQPGASPNTRAVGTDAVLGVEIDGTSAGGNGLTLGGAGQRVTGLAINRFSTGIRIESAATNAVVAGNYVGTDATGTADLGNGEHGVFIIFASDVRIGTDGDGTADAAERNVISGNDSYGVYVAGREAGGAVVAGNYIGTDAAGTDDLGNGEHGVFIHSASDVRIGTDGYGTADAAKRNVISGNNSNGVYVVGAGAADAVVAGNYIGTDAAGTADLGNAGHGVAVDGAPNVRVGTDGDGTADAAEGNRVRANGLDGVSVMSGSASVLGNAIAGNAGLGIDLGADGVLANDPDDPDAGASDLQNYPVVTAAMAVGDDTVVFTLDSTPRTDFRVELFASPTADPTGYGEGARFLGAVTVTTDGRGDATGAWPAAGGLVAGEVVTATATAATGPSAFGGTSEFSKAVVVGAFLVDTRSDDQTYVAGVSEAECTDATPGNCTLREAIEVANANAGLDVIGFDIPGRGVATIQPTSPLPPLTDAGVTLDGYTQPGASPNTRAVGTDAVLGVEIDGTRAGDGVMSGLTLNGAGQRVTGLAIYRFSTGIRIESAATNAVVAGNYVGTDATGTARRRNTGSGVFVNGALGVRIGTDGDGTADAAERNVISGNNSNGVYVVGAGAADAVVAGNYIGTDAAGTADLGNAGHGVAVDGAPNVRVGTDGDGTADAAEGNRVRANGLDGVSVMSGSASVLGNAIAGNAGLGIDLGADGVLANDPDDPDAGASDLQNYPVVTAAMAVGDDTVVFTLDSTPRTDFRVELFASPTADPTGYGEGARFLGAVTVTTDGRGDATGAWPAAGGLVAGEVVTATATAATGPSAFGGTSEFSLAVTVASGLASSATLVGAEGWRMLASPEATTLDAFLGTLWTQGYTGSDDPAGECTVYVFDEAAASFAAGWTCAADATDPLAPGEGVMVYVYEDDDATTSDVDGGFPKTLTSSTAVAPTGDFAFDVAITDDGRTLANKGWNLLGAPFGTSFEWAAMARTGVGPTVYVYDPAHGGTGGYRTYTLDAAGDFGDLPGGIVPPFQGFFVKAHSGSPPTLVLPEAGNREEQDAYGRVVPADPPLPPSAPAQSVSGATSTLGDGPLQTALGTVAPNPTTGAATLTWSLAEAGEARISVVDLLGREVAVLAEGSFAAGWHRAEVAAGRLAAGVYVVRLQAGDAAEAARFTVTR